MESNEDADNRSATTVISLFLPGMESAEGGKAGVGVDSAIVPAIPEIFAAAGDKRGRVVSLPSYSINRVLQAPCAASRAYSGTSKARRPV